MRSVRIIIQCRLSSTRLPAKALLPIGGMPIVVLSALRAANTGIPRVVAISDHESDDILADTLEKYNVSYIRGPLENVLERFVLATNDMHDDDVVIRLTADNVFPDGAFLGLMLDDFKSSEVDILRTKSPEDLLPYGLSAEIFKVKFLRIAFKQTKDLFDCEHVTPYVLRNYRSKVFRLPSNLSVDDFGSFRATVDTFSDYVRVSSLFLDIKQPIDTTWDRLCRQLKRVSPSSQKVPQFEFQGKTRSSITLGTVQLGMLYGATNTTGQPKFQEASEILLKAASYGITDFDSASSYGQSEDILGKVLKSVPKDSLHLITKLDTMEHLETSLPSNLEIKASVRESVYRSLYRLQVRSIDTLLLHRFSHMFDFNGEIFRILKSLKKEGLVGSLGVSVYTPEEAVLALRNPDINHIQLPLNLIDWRWDDEDFQMAAQERNDVIIHARSVYLQGLLLGNELCWPTIDNVDSRNYVKQIDDLVAELDRSSRADLCVAFVLGHSWVSSAVIGVDTLPQLDDSVSCFFNSPLTQNEIDYVKSALPVAPISLLNPSRWP